MLTRRSWPALVVVAATAFVGGLAAEEQPSPKQPTVFVAGTEEGGTPMMSAHVTTSGPVEGLTVRFFAQRSFGLLPVGEAETDAEGIAKISFPKDLPGDARGNVKVIAVVEGTDEFAEATGHAVIGWGAPVPHDPEPFPPALWSPRAPRGLLIVICVVFGGIWLTYGFVLTQLIQIARGGRAG